MKRNALKWSAGLIAGFATLLASCGTDYKIDTVLKLDKADVTAVAYPGVNMISWEPIASAQGYTVYVYEEDVYKSSTTTNACSYSDSNNLVNDKEYTYYVVAESNTDPAKFARNVVVQSSIGYDSVTAIVPPMGTKALDLVAYEDGYDGEVLTPDTEDDEYILTADRVKTLINDAALYVSFPAKSYLNYAFKLYDKALDHTVYNSDYSNWNGKSTTANVNVNNIDGQASFTALDGGKYQLAVQVSAKGNSAIYPVTEVIIGDVEIAKLDVSKISNINVDYLYTEGNTTVRIKFTSPKKSDGTVIPADWKCKVYRSKKGDYDVSEVTGTIYSESGYVNGTLVDTWYVDDTTVPDSKVEYVYYVVVTDGKAFGGLNQQELGKRDLARSELVSGLRGVQTKNATSGKYIYNSITWTITKNNNVKTLAVKDIAAAYVLAQDEGRAIDVGYLPTEIETKGKNVTDLLSVDEEGNLGLTTVIPNKTGTDKYTAYLLVVVNESGKEVTKRVTSAEVNLPSYFPTTN